MSLYGSENLLGGQYTRIYDRHSHETLDIINAKVKFVDDFNYTTICTTTEHGPWLLKDIHVDATETIVANQSGGVAGLHIGATAAEQEAGLTFGNALTFDLDKGVVFESRCALITQVPTGLAEIYFGIANAYTKGRLAAADEGPTVHAVFHNSVFGGAAGGLTKIYTDDASTDNAAVTTATTLSLATFYIFRIDVHDVTSVKFYINGVRVAATTTFNMANLSDVVVQPYFMIYKDGGAGLGDLYIDYCKMFQLAR
jgi:hypothetical protein